MCFHGQIIRKISREAKCQLVLDEFVNKQLQEMKMCLEKIQVRIPELIKADKMLYQQLTDERRKQ